MTWMLFLDESGHDHKRMTFEVRGGIALLAPKLRAFVQAWQGLEEHCFGAVLADCRKEVEAKGAKLFDKDRRHRSCARPLRRPHMTYKKKEATL